MKTLIKIAWRNIWRNPRRSWVLMSTIAVGMIGYLGTSSYTRGLMYEMINSGIRLQGGHIQILPEGFLENPSIQLFIRSPQRIEQVLDRFEMLHYAPFITMQGMASSSEAASGVIIHGIEPEKERRVTIVAETVVEGAYLQSDGPGHQVLIGEELARKLNVRLGEKIVLMTNAVDNTIASGAFRVAGIFRSVSPDFNKLSVFILLSDARALIGYQDQINGFSIHLPQGVELEQTMERLRAALPNPDLQVVSWRERNPILVFSLATFEYFIFLFLLIIFAAVAFTIINSFLMVIYERIREFGVMMAIGTLPRRIRLMLYLETVFITTLGILLGTGISYLLFGYFERRGLDLSMISDALGKFGISSVIHPSILLTDVLIGVAVINLLTLIAVIYPAYKASRFKVVDALTFV